MKKYNTALWIQNLEAIYQQALSTKPVKPFFLAVYDYVNYALTTDTLSQLSDVFYVHKKADYEVAEQYKKELIEYIETVLPKLEKYETTDLSEKDDIKTALSIRKGSTQVLGDSEGWLSIFGHFECMSWDAFRNDKVNTKVLELIGVEENDGKKATKWKALEIRDRYKTELGKMERLRETRGWYAWEHLRLFYEMFNDYESVRSDVVKRERWFEVMNMSYIKQELDAILKNSGYDQMQVFIYDNYIIYLHKAHRQLVNEIAQFEEISNKQSEKHIEQDKAQKTFIPYVFDVKNAVLTIKNEIIKFRKDTRKLALLKLLVKKSKGVYYDEAIEELEGAITDEAFNAKNSYYEACRGIEISISKKGITDFIIFDFNQAKVNPLYKLTPL